jgi:hypothetical protein
MSGHGTVIFAEKSLHPVRVDFEEVDVLVNMCALLCFLSSCREASDCTELDAACCDQHARNSAKYYAEIAESLILRLQDALDEKRLEALVCGDA